RSASRRGPNVQADEHALGVREIADDPAHRLGQTPHERRHREDLIARGELRVLGQIDDLDLVPAGQVLLADPLEIGERLDGLGRLAGGVEPQDLDGLARLVLRRGHARANLRHFHTSPLLTSPLVRFTLSPLLASVAAARRVSAALLRDVIPVRAQTRRARPALLY